jgi:hypothetical protein
MTTAFAIPAFALITLAGAVAQPSQEESPALRGAPLAVTGAQADPVDCPFCGGNPALHVKRIFQIERITLALSVDLLR